MFHAASKKPVRRSGAIGCRPIRDWRNGDSRTGQGVNGVSAHPPSGASSRSSPSPLSAHVGGTSPSASIPRQRSASAVPGVGDHPKADARVVSATASSISPSNRRNVARRRCPDMGSPIASSRPLNRPSLPALRRNGFQRAGPRKRGWVQTGPVARAREGATLWPPWTRSTTRASKTASRSGTGAAPRSPGVRTAGASIDTSSISENVMTTNRRAGSTTTRPSRRIPSGNSAVPGLRGASSSSTASGFTTARGATGSAQTSAAWRRTRSPGPRHATPARGRAFHRPHAPLAGSRRGDLRSSPLRSDQSEVQARPARRHGQFAPPWRQPGLPA